MTVALADMNIPYDKFINDVARRVVSIMKEEARLPEFVSQRQACRMFGRANVERWRRSGKIQPLRRPGKLQYRTSELRDLQSRQQDYDSGT